MRIALLSSALAFAAIHAPAQETRITSNGKFVFIVRGDELLQYSASSLQLLNRVQLPAPLGADRPAAATVGATATATVEIQDAAISPKDVQATLEAGFRWIAENQSEDGRWDADSADAGGAAVHDVGVTGLALLALLGEGNTPKAGPRAGAVEKGLAWLMGQQDPKTGLIGTTSSQTFIYDHAIATLALVEAFGLTEDAKRKPAAQAAINYLERHRNPYQVWRYQPRDGDNDTSVTGWCVMCYRSGLDFGLEVNEQALKLAGVWLDQMTDPETGRTGYARRGSMSSRIAGDHAQRFPQDANEAMTGSGMFARFLLGQKPDEQPILKTQADLIVAKPPRWEAGSIDEYAWYVSTYALFQFGGEPWKAWRRNLESALVPNQVKEGDLAGSWDPIGVWGEEGGRIFATSLHCLSLAASYRYAKLVR
ncbi:MAG: hypothetical protein O2865_01620 [Planctomycetota bacterium]|nr:hypothetical protein [Planctomycetota bacterium]MDA1220552.1 hypothetical protein [Planctomycetota bacterium]